MMSSSATYEEVERAASALPDGLDILRLSEPLGSLLIRRPERLAGLVELGPEPPETDGLFAGLDGGSGSNLPPALAYLSEGPHSLSEQMAGLRRFFWDGVFTWGARQVCRRASVERGLSRYTGLVESILRSALAVVAGHEGDQAPEAGWAVIALGRLGTVEMDLGSDLDVIFVAPDSASHSATRPATERLIHVLSAYTREGTILPVDVRLRPHGGEGELVQTTEAVLEYFSRTAEVWEAATYLKARPVAGDSRVGEDFCRCLQDVLRERFTDWEMVRPALAEMRKRLEEERARSLEHRDNFKTGPGGIYDLDFLISGRALREGATSLARRPLVARGEMLLGMEGAVGLEAKELLEAARLFAVVDHAIRLVTGQGSARLPVGQRGASVAELASHWLGDELAPGELAARLDEARRSVRAVFAKVFG
jgi:glutamate-ammonia-ligase adenylyltransferase